MNSNMHPTYWWIIEQKAQITEEFSSWSVQNSQNIHFLVAAAQEPNGTIMGFISRNLDDHPSD